MDGTENGSNPNDVPEGIDASTDGPSTPGIAPAGVETPEQDAILKEPEDASEAGAAKQKPPDKPVEAALFTSDEDQDPPSYFWDEEDSLADLPKPSTSWVYRQAPSQQDKERLAAFFSSPSIWIAAGLYDDERKVLVNWIHEYLQASDLTELALRTLVVKSPEPLVETRLAQELNDYVDKQMRLRAKKSQRWLILIEDPILTFSTAEIESAASQLAQRNISVLLLTPPAGTNAIPACKDMTVWSPELQDFWVRWLVKFGENTEDEDQLEQSHQLVLDTQSGDLDILRPPSDNRTQMAAVRRIVFNQMVAEFDADSDSEQTAKKAIEYASKKVKNLPDWDTRFRKLACTYFAIEDSEDLVVSVESLLKNSKPQQPAATTLFLLWACFKALESRVLLRSDFREILLIHLRQQMAFEQLELRRAQEQAVLAGKKPKKAAAQVSLDATNILQSFDNIFDTLLKGLRISVRHIDQDVTEVSFPSERAVEILDKLLRDDARGYADSQAKVFLSNGAVLTHPSAQVRRVARYLQILLYRRRGLLSDPAIRSEIVNDLLSRLTAAPDDQRTLDVTASILSQWWRQIGETTESHFRTMVGQLLRRAFDEPAPLFLRLIKALLGQRVDMVDLEAVIKLIGHGGNIHARWEFINLIWRDSVKIGRAELQRRLYDVIRKELASDKIEAASIDYKLFLGALGTITAYGLAQRLSYFDYLVSTDEVASPDEQMKLLLGDSSQIPELVNFVFHPIIRYYPRALPKCRRTDDWASVSAQFAAAEYQRLTRLLFGVSLKEPDLWSDDKQARSAAQQAALNELYGVDHEQEGQESGNAEAVRMILERRMRENAAAEQEVLERFWKEIQSEQAIAQFDLLPIIFIQELFVALSMSGRISAATTLRDALKQNIKSSDMKDVVVARRAGFKLQKVMSTYARRSIADLPPDERPDRAVLTQYEDFYRKRAETIDQFRLI